MVELGCQFSLTNAIKFFDEISISSDESFTSTTSNLTFVEGKLPSRYKTVKRKIRLELFSPVTRELKYDIIYRTLGELEKKVLEIFEEDSDFKGYYLSHPTFSVILRSGLSPTLKRKYGFEFIKLSTDRHQTRNRRKKE